ncbi:MAG: 8-oxo-dGTP diphosphatase MutT [Halioglobus sp.]
MLSTEPDAVVVHVAVGVILDEQSRVLISRRAANAHQGNLWEFPGGKVEPGETVVEALSRELQEELGIAVVNCVPLLVIEHDYSDKAVRLDVHVVDQFENTAQGLEGQPLSWVLAEDLAGYDFPAANVPIIEAVMRHVEQRSD